jgi:hypothetical protein
MTQTTIKLMKSNNEQSIHPDSLSATETKSTSEQRRFLFRLKVLLVGASVIAGWLSYQAVGEAIVLNRMLDRVHEEMGKPLTVKGAGSHDSNITETKSRVAGL